MMRVPESLARHGRTATVASIGAVLAFGGSFLVEPTYSSSTLVLIRGRDATFLTSTGEDLSTQPGVVDSSMAESLAATYAGMATSTEIATTVVEELELDERPARSGFVHAVAGAFAWVYRCSRAVLTAGFCADVDTYDEAVAAVQSGITVAPVGANEGATAGTTGSYVLQVSASGGTPEEAKTVTDAVADELIGLSSERFQVDSAENVRSLERLVAEAEDEVTLRSVELAGFQTENGIIGADGRQVLSTTTYEAVRQQLIEAQAKQAELEAQLAAIEDALAATPRTQSASQSVVTGRSTTEVTSQSTSTVRSDLEIQRRTLQAQIQGQVARGAELQAALDGPSLPADNAVLAELSTMESALALAQANLQDVNGQLQDARVTDAQSPVDLTRVDTASTPTYPTAPKRYLYLVLGLLIGGVAGLGLTVYLQRRGGPAAEGLDEPADEPADEPDATDADSGGQVREDLRELETVSVDGPTHRTNGTGRDRPDIADRLFRDDD
jgi:uncharacterized protein involved in exopolysaccharide biosynthesis